jgi:serine/threonine protein kinase
VGSISLKRIKKKIICALRSEDANENVDVWLTIAEKPMQPILKHNMKLAAVFAKSVKNKQTGMCAMDDFEKIKVIGRGGFAEKVYLARKKDTGSIFAIKTMSKHFILQEEGRLEQLFGELEVMRRLTNHPFVIKLFWAFQTDEYLHFVMDFCSGGELFYLLQGKRLFTEAEAKFYFAEMLLGLEYVHN